MKIIIVISEEKFMFNPPEYVPTEGWDQTALQMYKHYIWTIHVVYHPADNNEPLSLALYTRQSTLFIVSSPWVSASYRSFYWSLQGQSEKRPLSHNTYYLLCSDNHTANSKEWTPNFLAREKHEFSRITMQKCPFLWSRIVMNESMWD